jgi:hypothetical protein
VAAVATLAAAGLTSQALGYHFARTDRPGPTESLFAFGLVLEFLPCAFVMTYARTPRAARLGAALVAGLSLFAAAWLAQPGMLARYDELLHLSTLERMADERGFFLSNTLIPIGPYYPGLELVTLGLHWSTGLSLGASEVLTVVLARCLLLVSLFGVVERLSHSPRAAGLATTLYLCNPQFYVFHSQYSYETLALALAVTGAYLALRAADAPAERKRLLPALAVFALLVVTHHLSGAAMLLTLVAVTVASALLRRRGALGVLAGLTAAYALMLGAWTLFVGGRLRDYLGPITEKAADSLADFAAEGTTTDQSFTQAPGLDLGLAQQLFVYGSILLWTALLGWALLSRSGRQQLRRRSPIRFVALGALLYPVLLALNVTPAAQQYAQRASAFVFVFLAAWIAVWGLPLLAAHRDRAHLLVVLVTGCLFIGGVLLGAGSFWNVLPGPYLVTADQRSVDRNALAVARWTAERVPPQTRVAADRVNSALMAAVGRQQPVTGAGGSVDVGPLFFADRIGEAERQLITGAGIRLLVVDQRLASGPPVVGHYFESVDADDPGLPPGARPRELTPAQLHKFERWDQATPIFRSGPITLYDISAVSGQPRVPLAASPRPRPGGTDWRPMVVAGALLIVVLATRRRRAAQDAVAALALRLTVLAVGLALIGALFMAVHVTTWPVIAGLGAAAAVACVLRRPRERVRTARPGLLDLMTGAVTVSLALASASLTVAAIVLAQ